LPNNVATHHKRPESKNNSAPNQTETILKFSISVGSPINYSHNSADATQFAQNYLLTTVTAKRKLATKRRNICVEMKLNLLEHV
jgi:hypothetical protein